MPSTSKTVTRFEVLRCDDLNIKFSDPENDDEFVHCDVVRKAGNNETIRIEFFEKTIHRQKKFLNNKKLMPHSYNADSFEFDDDCDWLLHFDQNTTVQKDDIKNLGWLFEPDSCDVEVTRFDVISIKDVCENNSGDPLQCDLVRQNGDNDTIRLEWFENDPSRKLTRSAKTEMDSMPHSYTADSRFELLGSFPSHWSLNFDECDAYQVEGDPKDLAWLFESDSLQQAVHDAYKAAQNEAALKARKSAFKNTLFAVSIFLAVIAIVVIAAIVMIGSLYISYQIVSIFLAVISFSRP